MPPGVDPGGGYRFAVRKGDQQREIERSHSIGGDSLYAKQDSLANQRKPAWHHAESEQEIPLRHRQDVGGLAGQEFAVGSDLVSFGVDGDGGRCAIVHHVALADLARV